MKHPRLHALALACLLALPGGALAKAPLPKGPMPTPKGLNRAMRGR